ncbi:35385_t:CDS:2 [Racocetra persica]|uniref:35385_t:CDS:1 n=1 Tax=Racocetra persica TaxID=160502 RepID=A0ACA9QN98_9GLOM|nr:35385_t:CDS:2 [Racocetra persica]
MGKKNSNSMNTMNSNNGQNGQNGQAEKKMKETKNLTNKLFESQELTLNVSPIAVISLFILLISIGVTWDKYRQQVTCQVLNNGCEDKISWISIPDYKNAESYLSLDNGAFVYRHIYMDEFEKEFNVKPLNFPTIDPDIAGFLERHNLRFRLLNNTEIDQELVSNILSQSEKYSPIIEEIKSQVENGSYVDDGRVYIRWVNDVVRWGMFAGRSFKATDLIGIYNGLLTRQLYDVEYAWEFNFLVDVLDDDGEKVRVCVDGKHMGNYMRFANHRDSKHNGDQLYVVHDDIWYVLYVAQDDIKPHEQIFVNYGQAYWENKQKYEF